MEAKETIKLMHEMVKEGKLLTWFDSDIGQNRYWAPEHKDKMVAFIKSWHESHK
jgi:hypothetical protein